MTEAVGAADVRAAGARLAGRVRHTPLERSDWLSTLCGCPVLLKLECWQHTRSFKVRGAFNALSSLTAARRARGVVTASAGNHGLAVALAAREHGVHATVFVPAAAPRIKRQRIEQLGAELIADAADYDAAERLAAGYAERTDRPFIHAFSDPAVVAGQGTVGLEILRDVDAVDTVLVPVGGGGLIGGLGVLLKAESARIRLMGVQSVETRAMYEAFRAGRLVDVPVTPTLADGLAGCTDTAAFDLARRVVDDIVLVDEDAIAAAIVQLYEREAVVAEGAAAVVIAAVLSGHITLRGPTVLVVTGGNIDGQRLSRLLANES